MRGYAAIGLYHPSKEVNVSGVIRAASCYDAALIVIEGIKYKRQSSDTVAGYKHIPLLHMDDLFSALPYDCVPVAVELLPDARNLIHYVHPERAMYIFGPENSSLGLNTVARCRDIVQVPTNRCMNLAATVNVVLYDRLAKSFQGR